MIRLLALFSLLSFLQACKTATPATASANELSPLLLAAPGRVETRDDPLEIGIAANGVLASFPFRQNDFVRAGQIVAEVDCRDIAADATQYEAERNVAIRARARLVAGGRPEDRAAAAARAQSAEAALSERRVWYERMKTLAASGDISQSTLDSAARDFNVAEAEHRAAVQVSRSAAAEPLPEDLAKADAEIEAAQGRITAARARLAKCTVVAPASGTVIHSYATRGESISVAAPKTLMKLADLTHLRVRAEVDEQDIGKLQAARAVTVTSEAYPGETFQAKLDRQIQAMGRRQTRTGDPAEKSDRDVLEYLIELDPAVKRKLPLGLRVTVQFWR